MSEGSDLAEVLQTIARIEERLSTLPEAFRAQIDAGDRETRQLIESVKTQLEFATASMRDGAARSLTFHEQIAGSLERLGGRLGHVETEQAVARRDQQQLNIDAVKLDERVTQLDATVDEIRNWRSRLIGVAVGAALGGGGIAGTIIKAFG